MAVEGEIRKFGRESCSDPGGGAAAVLGEGLCCFVRDQVTGRGLVQRCYRHCLGSSLGEAVGEGCGITEGGVKAEELLHRQMWDVAPCRGTELGIHTAM